MREEKKLLTTTCSSCAIGLAGRIAVQSAGGKSFVMVPTEEDKHLMAYEGDWMVQHEHGTFEVYKLR